jgi:acetylornithine deacetylase/succinyl-diaminopimelate desuccinylase-like protein
MAFDLVAAARDLVALDSRSSLSDGPVVDLLAGLCRQAGLAVTTQEESRDGQRQYNLLAWRDGPRLPARRGEQRSDTLLLATHLDTVPPGDPGLWTRTGGDPFALTLHEGRLYGLGAADVKIDFLCKLAALERLREEPLQRPVLLAGTYGEETGRWGAKLLAGSLRPLPALALVGEPSGLRPTPAHKGYVEFRVTAEALTRPAPALPLWSLTFTGKAAHSSQPHVGVSANDACLDLLSRLVGTRSEGRAIAVVGIEGGDLVNKVAATCRLILCAAELPDVSRIGEVAVGVSPLPADAFGHGPLTSPDLAELLLRIHAATRLLDAELRGQVVDGFEPPWSTVNNGLLKLAPGRLEYVVDVRSVPVGSTSPGPVPAGSTLPGRVPLRRPEAVVDEYERRLDECRKGSGCTVAVRRLLEAAPFLAADDSVTLAALTETLRSLDLPTDTELKSGTTEAPVYQTAGMDVVVFGPGEATGNIHRPNEHVPVAHLELAVDTYADVIRRLCGGEGRS